MANEKIIELSDHGIVPNTCTDYTDKLNELFGGTEENVVYRFRKGVYRFHSTNGVRAFYSMANNEPILYRTLSFLIRNRKNITIDGGGSRFLFCGFVQPITLDQCENVTLRNFSVDYEKPLVSEGIIIGKSTDYLEVRIDQRLYPCFVRDSTLYFDLGDDQISELTRGKHTVYGSSAMTVLPESCDGIRVSVVEQRSPEVFRLYITEMLPKDKPPFAGDVIVLEHNKHMYAGIFADRCRGLHYENIDIFSAGEGTMFQFSEDITCRNLRFVPNRKLGRRIACVRDYGMQIVGCSGTVGIEGCSFHGLQDDPVNIHGAGVCIRRIEDDHTVIGEFARTRLNNFAYWAKPGDRIGFIDRRLMKSLGSVEISSFGMIDRNGFMIRTVQPIPERVRSYAPEELVIRNLSQTPSVHIRNNYFGSCRARGIFLTAANDVCIENNVFESAGSAIVIPGDASSWYAVGECRNVTIRNNTFTDECMLSDYQYCHAVISVCPDIPHPLLSNPYHRNIVITDNIFMSCNTQVLYAFSVEGLCFRNNTVIKTERYENDGTGKYLYYLKNCRGAEISGNVTVGKFSVKELKTEKTTMKNSGETD